MSVISRERANAARREEKSFAQRLAKAPNAAPRATFLGDCRAGTSRVGNLGDTPAGDATPPEGGAGGSAPNPPERT